MSPKGILATATGFGAGVCCSTSALKKMLAHQRVKQWPSVNGTIIESVLYQDPARKNATHFRVKYEFIIGDKIIGATPRFSGDWFWNNTEQAKFVAKFTQGQKVEVFYDPKDPTKNCLDREDISGITILWIIALGGISLASLLFWLDTSE